MASPVVTAVAIVVAIALGIALAVSNARWQAERSAFAAQLRQLTEASGQVSTLKTELAACQAARDDRRASEAEYAALAATPEGRRRLLEQQPAGFDACARMESADRAVLSNLKK